MLLLAADYPSSLCHAARRLAEGEPAYVEFFKPVAAGAAPPAGMCFGVLPRGLEELDEKLRPEWEKARPELERAAQELSRDPRLPAVARAQRERLDTPPMTQRAAVVWTPPGADAGGRYEDGVVLVTLSTSMPAVLAHELAHAAWAHSPLRRELERALARRREAGILAATLLDEGVAGALGPGLLRQPGAWDADPVFDAFAKSLGGQVDEASALRAAAALDPVLRVKDRFRRAIIVADGEALARHAAKSLDVRQAWLYTDLEAATSALGKRWETPVIVLVPPEGVDELKLLLGPEVLPAEVEWIREKARKGTAVALTWSPRGRPILVICGRPETVASALPQIAGMPAPSGSEPAQARAGR